MRILITGGCGFIGHHFVDHFLKNSDFEIVVLDRVTHASKGFDRLRDLQAFDDQRVKILSADFTQEFGSGLRRDIGAVDYILHLGAETHVDVSRRDPTPFVVSNIYGTFNMLQFARSVPHLKTFFYFSTEEVFGPAPEGVAYKEDDRHNPVNPYSATKSGGEMLAKAYHSAYGLPIIITRTINVFGERQHPEKFIPMIIKKVLAGEKVIIHANPAKTKAGSRFWIHARNAAHAYSFLLEKGKIGEAYHIVGEREVDNLEMARIIAQIRGKELRYEMAEFLSVRPGDGVRHALDGTKMKNLGWQIPMTFEESLKKTIQWTLAHPQWLNF